MQKLRNQAIDVRIGDPVCLQIDVQHLNLVNDVKKVYTQFSVEEILAHHQLGDDGLGKHLFVFIRAGPTRLECHVIRSTAEGCQTSDSCLSNVVS